MKPYILQFLLISVGYLTYTTNLGIFENENSYFVEEEASGMETTISRTTARYYHFFFIKKTYQERPGGGYLTVNYTGTHPKFCNPVISFIGSKTLDAIVLSYWLVPNNCVQDLQPIFLSTE